MNTIAEFMSTFHKTCDEAFALAEENAVANNWGPADAAFNTFRHDMERHFHMEQEVLFPALLEAGGPAGPVQVMLMEHAQMNDLIGQLGAALADKNAQQYGGVSETLLIVMQQHNLKEEQILYTIADRILAATRESVISRMQTI